MESKASASFWWAEYAEGVKKEKQGGKKGQRKNIEARAVVRQNIAKQSQRKAVAPFKVFSIIKVPSGRKFMFR